MKLNTIHIEFSGILRKFIARHIKDSDDVEDILQEVFIKISNQLHSLKQDEKLKSWIFTIARNSITDYYRKKSKKSEIRLDETFSYNIPHDEEHDFANGLEHCFSSFIQELPAEYRDIIIDSEIKGLKQKDLAEKYRLAYPTLRSRVQRGRTRLKEMLVNCCSIELDRRGNVISSVYKKTGKSDCGTCD